MKYKYAVFDWDGTLADTYPVISAAYDYTFDKMGLLRIPYDEIKRITSTLQNKDTLGYVFKERRDEAAGYFTNISKIPHRPAGADVRRGKAARFLPRKRA